MQHNKTVTLYKRFSSKVQLHVVNLNWIAIYIMNKNITTLQKSIITLLHEMAMKEIARV